MKYLAENMDLFKRLMLVILSFGLLVLSGCASIGPRTVVHDRFNHTGAMADSWKQQMLINMVKMRYGDTPVFLDVASIISGYTLETGVNIFGQVSPQNMRGDTFGGLGAHGTFADRPPSPTCRSVERSSPGALGSRCRRLPY
jgi:hypothetical protein